MQRIGATVAFAARRGSSRAFPSLRPLSALSDGVRSERTGPATDFRRRLSSAPDRDAGRPNAEASSPPPPPQSTPPPRSFADRRTAILDAALSRVVELGWTEDAIAAGALSAGLPPASIGIVDGNRSVELVAHFMDRCNDDLRRALIDGKVRAWDGNADEADAETAKLTTVPERIEAALRVRLEMVAPLARAGRWHEAMALGVSSPEAAARTARQLDAMAEAVLEFAGAAGGSPLDAAARRATVVAAFAATELHMLADGSEGLSETWSFLKMRVGDLEMMAGVASGGPVGLVNGDAVFAASTIAASLGGAAISLARPAAAGVASAMASTVVPHIMTFMQPNQMGVAAKGTSPRDYDMDDLPPFEDETITNSKDKRI